MIYLQVTCNVRTEMSDLENLGSSRDHSAVLLGVSSTLIMAISLRLTVNL